MAVNFCTWRPNPSPLTGLGGVRGSTGVSRWHRIKGSTGASKLALRRKKAASGGGGKLASINGGKRAKAPQKEGVVTYEFEHHKALRIIMVIATLLLIGWVGVALFEPTPAYRIHDGEVADIAGPQMVREIEGLTGAPMLANNRVEPIFNGENYYEAEIAAMQSAQHSVDLEAYIFKEGEVARRVVEVLANRARSGVKVNVVVDAMGSTATTKRYFKPLLEAGGRVFWYHPLRWDNWFRFNNRTHRELLVIDGRIAFAGGAGYADYWHHDVKKEPRWRDSMFRVTGPAVTDLQATFVENWLESSDEIIAGPDYFPEPEHVSGAPAIVVSSSPSTGGSTRARILFQRLLSAAKKSIDITTPYFLPDKGVRDELLKAARERGVKIRLIVPGERTDHKVVRASSRSNYGELLKAGAKIYEYQPAMIHQKLLVVDGEWVVVGSTNFDTRSFGLNDEVNVAVIDPQLAQRVTSQFDLDARDSRQVTLQEWQKRSLWERGEAILGWVWGRQQ